LSVNPNYSDLIYCGSKDENGNLQTFRYTQNQRRLETRLKKYNKIIDKINKETKIENQTIKEIETELSFRRFTPFYISNADKYII
jgi:hypothetical protein